MMRHPGRLLQRIPHSKCWYTSRLRTRDLSALMMLLADAFALYVKTKNVHWHMRSHYFRDHHLLLVEQNDRLLSITDDIAERVWKIGGVSLRSIGQIARLKRIEDNDEKYVTPMDMLRELWQDNMAMAASRHSAHDVWQNAGDVASTSALET